MSAGDGAGLNAALLERIAVLRGQPCIVEPLPGGLTNKNYKVSTPIGTYVVRHSKPPSADALAVDRRAEYENSVRAAAAGVGAPVIEFLPDDGLLVIGFVEGETLSDEHLQAPGILPRVAEACRRLHAGPAFVNRFDMFELQPDYLARVQHRGFRLPPGYLDHAGTVRRIRLAMAVRPVDLRPCNNDLLAANFIDDGRRVSIIDYEYSGNNDPYFELGNIWSECHLTLEQLEELVVAYDGSPSRSHLARCRLWGLMSQYGWTLWASIQDGTSGLDFDFWSWGMDKYERAEATFADPELERLLADVTRAD
ncbi:MAG TPA: phosphotransferase [Acidimicrobiales bacterium]|nr:phosphotransferase [Acidimicrobiales bacterium]